MLVGEARHPADAVGSLRPFCLHVLLVGRIVTWPVLSVVDCGSRCTRTSALAHCFPASLPSPSIPRRRSVRVYSARQKTGSALLSHLKAPLSSLHPPRVSAPSSLSNLREGTLAKLPVRRWVGQLNMRTGYS